MASASGLAGAGRTFGSQRMAVLPEINGDQATSTKVRSRVHDARFVGSNVSSPILISISGSPNRSSRNVGNLDDPIVG